MYIHTCTCTPLQGCLNTSLKPQVVYEHTFYRLKRGHTSLFLESQWCSHEHINSLLAVIHHNMYLGTFFMLSFHSFDVRNIIFANSENIKELKFQPTHIFGSHKQVLLVSLSPAPSPSHSLPCSLSFIFIPQCFDFASTLQNISPLSNSSQWSHS